jgi:putative endonuclease
MREHLYSVYIMASLSGVLYIGVTSDLQTRVRQHKAGTFKGFSNKYQCHRLVYYERYDYIQAAIGREKQLKGFTRKKKVTLIESLNPRWQDLSESWEREHLVPRQSMKEADEASARRIKLSLDGSGPRSLAKGKLDRNIAGDPSRKRCASG